jgi:hypothetical protein
MEQNQKQKAGRKIGTNRRKCDRYRMTNRLERNKRREQEKREKHFEKLAAKRGEVASA